MTYPPKEDQNRLVVDLYNQNIGPTDIARELGISRQRVHAIIRRWKPEFDRQDAFGKAKAEHDARTR